MVTPSLNKSFKFQSDWPYNNSQIYLLGSLINDINSDKNSELIEKNNKYIIKSSVKYVSNKKLSNQKIVLGSDKTFEKVIVYDKDGCEAMTMIFDRIDYSYKFKKDEFDLDNIIDNEDKTDVKETSSIDDIIYPLYVPDGTKLVNEDKIKKENGERVIMDYDGDKSFLLVEETSDVFNEFTVIPTIGEPYLVMDTLGVMGENSLSWSSNGIDYYLVSDVMSKDELVEIAKSVVSIPISK